MIRPDAHSLGIDDEAPAQGDNAPDPRAAMAEADVLAGRVVPNAKVIDWLKTWGRAERSPAPYSWRK